MEGPHSLHGPWPRTAASAALTACGGKGGAPAASPTPPRRPSAQCWATSKALHMCATQLNRCLGHCGLMQSVPDIPFGPEWFYPCYTTRPTQCVACAQPVLHNLQHVRNAAL